MQPEIHNSDGIVNPLRARIERMNLAPAWSVEPLRKLMLGYFRFFHSSTFEGMENVPPKGPVILASNHTSYFDPFLINISAGKPTLLKFMAWEALFKEGFVDRLMRAWGAFPVDPEGKDPGGYRDALEQLRKGERVVIFPEGGRSYDGKLLEFREGFARLAIQSKATIVPVCILGAEMAWPRGDLCPRLWFPIHVRYLPPIQARAARGPEEKRAEAKRLTDEIVAAIQGELDAHAP